MNDLGFELLEFQIQIATLRIVVRIIDCLNGQLTHTFHHVRDFVGRPLSCLNQRNAVSRISNRLIQTTNLIRHPS